MFGITTDGTYMMDALGNIVNAVANVASGYVVALGPLADETEVAPSVTFGRWEDQNTGTVYWDRVTILDSLDAALDAAKRIGELAIWDLGQGQEIRVA